MDLLTIYSLWLTTISIGSSFLPLVMILAWRRLGTADGFSSVNLVLPIFNATCWLNYGLAIHDPVNTYVSTANIFISSCYVLTFAYYQKRRKYLYFQLSILLIALSITHIYISSKPKLEQTKAMGWVAAMSQIMSFLGGVYDIKRAIRLNTTKYIPHQIQIAIFPLNLQWVLYGALISDRFILITSSMGTVVNMTTLSLYILLPRRRKIRQRHRTVNAKAMLKPFLGIR